jgi:hypothetical protein
MLIATFGPGSSLAGRTITFEAEQFAIEGHGRISAAAVVGYDHVAQLIWASPEAKDCVLQHTSRSKAATKSGSYKSLSERLSSWSYAVAFAVGLAFSIFSWAVTGALGDASWSLPVDWAVGLISLAFAASLLTGINLGKPSYLRNVLGDAGSLVNVSAGMCLLVFSLTVLFVGPIFSGLAQ